MEKNKKIRKLEPKVETISIKIPYELYRKIKETPDLNRYPVEELTMESEFFKESCRKVEQIKNDVEQLNDFWLKVIEK